MAYRNLAKECHPDYLGDQGHNICILLNEVLPFFYHCTLSVPLAQAKQGQQGRETDRDNTGPLLNSIKQHLHTSAIGLECSIVPSCLL